MFDYSISFRVTYQAECVVSVVAVCISIALVLQMYMSKCSATSSKPGLRRRRSPFVIQPLYEPILWLGLLVFTVRTLLLMVPGPYPAPPSWFSGAVESVGLAVPDAGALQHVEASRWVLDSSFYFMYWFSFSLLSEGVSLFFCFSSPSARAVAFSLKWAVLLAALLATVTTVAFSHQQLDWPPVVHQTLDALFLMLPCTLHIYVLCRAGGDDSERTRWAPVIFAAFNLTWRLLSAAAIQAAVYQTIVGSVLKAMRALGMPLAVYGSLASDTQHWHQVLRSVMTTRQVVAVYSADMPQHKRDMHEHEPLLGGAGPSTIPEDAPPPSSPPTLTMPAAAKSPTQAFAASLLDRLDASVAISPMARPRVASAGGHSAELRANEGGSSGTQPPPLLRTSSAGNVLLKKRRRQPHRRKRADTTSYSLMFLEPEQPPAQLKTPPLPEDESSSFALQVEGASAASGPATYGTSSAAAPLLLPRRHARSMSTDSTQWDALKPPPTHLGEVTSPASGPRASAGGGGGAAVSPVVRGRAPSSPDARGGGVRSAPLRSGIISPHELQVFKDQVLGRGATSTVYKGRWQSRPVAVKRVVPDVLDAATLAQFHEETMLLAALQHKRITRFYGLCVRPPGIELVFRLASGGSLWDCLGSSTAAGMTTRQRLLLAVDGADAVAHLHSLKPAPIVHRDIKSPNFLVQEGGRLQLGDFGQAAPLPSTGTFPPALDEQALGTHGWAAPEVLMGHSYGPAVDVYALGVVLWEIWTARRPYHDVPAEAMLFRVAVEGLRPAIPPSMPKRLSSLLRQCWSSSPHDRPTAAQVALELRAFLHDLSSHRKSG